MVEPTDNTLSEREIEILRQVATGVSNKEIAQNLDISPNTVKVHLRNIFAKLGVASRTEATLYAIRHGYAPVPTRPPSETEAVMEAPALEDEAPAPGLNAPEPPLEPVPARPRWMGGLGLGLLALAALAVWWTASRPAAVTPTPLPTVLVSQWEPRAPLPEARQGLAVTVYENQLYAIAGETAATVTGRLDKYDPAGDTWQRLADKPRPVTDAGAVTIGGQIYVPGGRLASGEVSAELAVYDPRQDAWRELAPLPAGRSAYAAVAFEGKLYLFGGWDGRAFTASVLVYDPGRDDWQELAPMPTARGQAGAVVVGDRIYIVGGTDGQRALTVVEVFSASRAEAGEPPWQTSPALPVGLTPTEALSLADVIYIIGAQDAATLTSWRFTPGGEAWQPLPSDPRPDFGARLAVLGATLHALGGQTAAGQPSARHLAYQAAYALFLPVISAAGD